MKISIIIPMYNSEKYIEKCINSILINEGDYEIIVVDDASNDKGLSICKMLAEKNKKINIISLETNKGVSNARNIGIQYAKGNFITFVDSDDFLEKDWYKNVVKELDSSYDMLFFNSKISEECTKYELIKYILGNNNEKIYLSAPYSKFFKTTFIKQYALKFEENIINGEDMLFNTEALLASKKYKIVNREIYKVVRNIGSLSRKFDEYIFTSEILFQKKLQKILENYSMKEEFLDWCNGNHIIILLNRISYIDNFELRKEQLKKINSSNEYRQIISSKNQNIKRKFIFWLLKHRCYSFLILLYELRNRIKILTKKIEIR